MAQSNSGESDRTALVVISHYNAWKPDQLIQLLDQMASIPAGEPFRTLVVVNRAVDRDLELPPRHSKIPVQYRENTGYNIGAWDHGWRSTPADFYLFLQEECVIRRPGWLSAFHRLGSRPDVGIVGETLVWPGYDWDRVEYLHVGSGFEVPSQARINHIDGVRDYLRSRGMAVAERPEHLQSLILGARREVLEAIDGFMIGHHKGEAIACEIAISWAVRAKGLRAVQVGRFPFRYVYHPQWHHLNLGAFSILLGWAERYAPIPLIHPAQNTVRKLLKLRTGQENEFQPRPT